MAVQQRYDREHRCGIPNCPGGTVTHWHNLDSDGNPIPSKIVAVELFPRLRQLESRDDGWGHDWVATNPNRRPSQRRVSVCGVFVLGMCAAISLVGLAEDIAGRDRVLRYVNDPASWLDSRVSAPIHIVMIIGCAALAAARSRRHT